jgi:replicative DNA helicase
LAKDLKIPILVLSQLNRATEKDRKGSHLPMLSDLRDSGSIEQDADVVMFIHREHYYDKTNPDTENEATLIIGKQRNGPTGVIPLSFNKKITRFSDGEKRKIMPQ